MSNISPQQMQQKVEGIAYEEILKIEKAYENMIHSSNFQDFYFIKEGIPSERPVIYWKYSGGVMIDNFKKILKENTTKFIVDINNKYPNNTFLYITDSCGTYPPNAFSTEVSRIKLLENYINYWGHQPVYTNIIEKPTYDFTPGMFYKHFKRETVDQNSTMYIYKIICQAVHTETGEDLIIYQAAYGDHVIYARPKSMFEEKVDKEKYPDIKQEYRFEPFYFDLKENK